jgi:hypothetical protein
MSLQNPTEMKEIRKLDISLIYNIQSKLGETFIYLFIYSFIHSFSHSHMNSLPTVAHATQHQTVGKPMKRHG